MPLGLKINTRIITADGMTKSHPAPTYSTVSTLSSATRKPPARAPRTLPKPTMITTNHAMYKGSSPTDGYEGYMNRRLAPATAAKAQESPMVSTMMALRSIPTMSAPVSSCDTALMARPVRVRRMNNAKATKMAMASRKANALSREMNSP